MIVIMSRSLTFPDLSFKIDCYAQTREHADDQIERYIAADRRFGTPREYLVATIDRSARS